VAAANSHIEPSFQGAGRQPACVRGRFMAGVVGFAHPEPYISGTLWPTEACVPPGVSTSEMDLALVARCETAHPSLLPRRRHGRNRIGVPIPAALSPCF